LVIVKCVDCGKEYELEPGETPYDFRCKCGGNLKYKEDKTLEKPLEEPKTEKKSRKIAIPLVVSIILIFIAFVVVINVGSVNSHQKDNPINISNNTTSSTPYIANKTYEGKGITFNYPADWQPIENLDSPSRWGYGEPLVAFYEPSNHGTAEDIETYFYIKRRDVGSLEEQLSSYRSDIAEIGQTEVSERNITVNGMRAVELIKTWSVDDKQYQALTVHIEAVPGRLYYRIGCVTTKEKYNATIPKFELVVYSFKPLPPPNRP
jgi:hypothetical protein